MTDRNEAGRPATGSAPPFRRVDRICNAIDWVNEWMGLAWGFSVVLVTIAAMWEIVARSFFGQATIWANETTIYLSAMTYLIAGGYALRHRRHVRIDVVYLMLSRRAQGRLDLLALLLFCVYAITLVWIGGEIAWTSILQREGTGTPWDPPIWPVKLAIPLAGLLLLLQGLANALRDFGFASQTGTNAG
ncbi:MAG: TRAP transporter small permease subunit [Rhodospirillales bacterium]|nr:TRAP transporter small permease subunit [Rhodospirillales bacterium]